MNKPNVSANQARSLYTAITGKESACEGKANYATQDDAERPAAAHNRWEKRQHDVEAYHCPFCEKWHKGRVASPAVLSLLSICTGGE